MHECCIKELIRAMEWRILVFRSFFFFFMKWEAFGTAVIASILRFQFFFFLRRVKECLSDSISHHKLGVLGRYFCSFSEFFFAVH